MFGPVLPALAAGHQVIAARPPGPRPDGRHRPADRRPAHGRRHRRAHRPPRARASRTSSATRSAAASRSSPRSSTRSRSASWSWSRPTSGATRSTRRCSPSRARSSAAAAEFMKDTPMYELYQRVAPRPGGLRRGCSTRSARRWRRTSTSARRSAGSQVPTLFVAADADMAPPSHYVEVVQAARRRPARRRLDGRGPAEGRARAGDPARRSTHYNVFTSPLFAAAVLAFLDAPEG